MTNMILFPISGKSTTFSDLSASKNGSSIANASFNELFSTLLSDMRSSDSSLETVAYSNELWNPIVMEMFNKLFGDFEQSSTYSADLPSGSPVNGVLTQTSKEGHVALDFGIPTGSSVKSTLAGKVSYAGWNNEGYGNLVIVDNGTFKTYYAHLSSIPVKVGDNVNIGDVVGLSGNTGNSTGPHLHYEIRKDGVAVNPIDYLSN